MAIPAKIKSLDEIGERYRDLYKPLSENAAEGFVLDVMRVDNYALEDVHGLKTGLQKSRAAETLAKKDLNAFKALAEERGTDINGLPDLITAAFTAADNPGQTDAATEARLKVERDQHAAAVAKLKGENTELRTSYERSQVEGEIASAVAAAGGSIALLAPLLAQRVKPIQQENGKIVARPVDIHGNPMLTNVSGEVGEMSVSEFINELKGDDNYAGAFAGNGVSGTGATANSAGRAAGGTSLDNLPEHDHVGRMAAASAEVARQKR